MAQRCGSGRSLATADGAPGLPLHWAELCEVVSRGIQVALPREGSGDGRGGRTILWAEVAVGLLRVAMQSVRPHERAGWPRGEVLREPAHTLVGAMGFAGIGHCSGRNPIDFASAPAASAGVGRGELGG